MNRKVIQVFMASPGGLDAERRVIRSRAARQNELLAKRLGVQLEVMGWEDLTPRAGRPQATINDEADLAHVFIGLVGSRWGTDTGEFSSGFEEEFERATKRFEATAFPDIRLFLKQIDTSDPGPQLSKVIAFRESLEADRKFRFKVFQDAADLAEHLDRLFVELICKHSSLLSAEAEAPEKRSIDAVVPSGPFGEDVFAGSPHASEVTMAVRALLNENGTDGMRGRALVFAVAKFSVVQTEQLLGTHALNSIYKNGRSWVLSSDEAWVLFRAMLQGENRPGWFWVRGFDEELVKSWLWHVVINDDDEFALGKAISLLRISEGDLPALAELERVFAKPQALAEIASWLETKGAASHARDLLNAWPKYSLEVQRKLSSALLLLTAKYVPSELARTLTLVDAGAAVRSDALSIIESRFDLQTTQRLLREVRQPSLRRRLAEDLISREEDVALLFSLEADTDAHIRKALALRKIKEGKRFSDDELHTIFPEIKQGTPGGGGGIIAMATWGLRTSIRLRDFYEPMLRQFTIGELQQRVDMFSEQGQVAYDVLASDHFHAVAEQLRQDVREDFSRIQAESDAKHGVVAGKTMSEIFSDDPSNDLVGFVRSKLANGVLRAFVAHGTPDDAWVARALMGRPYAESNLEKELTRFLARFGEAVDVPAMLRLAAEAASPDHEELLARTAMVSGEPEKVLDTVLDQGTLKSPKWALEVLLRLEDESAMSRARNWIASSDEKVRALGAAYVAVKLDSSELLELLTAYLNQETYYYDVVATLDKKLFAPTSIRREAGTLRF